ncbi:sensor domain-containing diguanylate cyclase [Allosphingosinicella indica]|uniref:diguanylate cyclase n=1 Tax=Allosphingosinicella indica TaxID=941907 RepID=A0A1X7GIH0_9SPHN|nr:GGDEF domain-containing protein [Allosphingosinicella indica]SMF70221.1 diguanylate cyclase (GGDEF) domain-containing protein [Allosphingosinicella indica]
MIVRLLFACACLLGFFAAPAAAAEFVRPTYCYALTPAGTQALPPPSAFRCGATPEDYSGQRLWLRTAVPEHIRDRGAVALMVHQSRFDKIEVRFLYPNGFALEQEVRAGDYGDRWRVGGQLAFMAAPHGDAAPVEILVAVDRLASFAHFRSRIRAAVDASREASLAATLIGGALTLLLLSAIYNALLAGASRRAFVVWHAAWVGTMLLWGLIWSQLALLVIPGLAGTSAARIGTCLATLAITFAAICAATCPEEGKVPRWLKQGVIALALAIAVLGLPTAFGPPIAIEILGPILGVMVLTVLAAVAMLFVVAWRRGSEEVRAFALAWAVPMLALAASELFNLDGQFLGGGSQLVVLVSSALQTLWLSVATTFRLSRFRNERDAARAAQVELRDLAQRDSLTGLLNRRGFVGHADAALAGVDEVDGSFALLLIDVDHFKSINDTFGHDAGDEVLRRIGARLEALVGPSSFAGRLGGEEFAIGVTNLSDQGLRLFAERARSAMADLSLTDVLGAGRRLTVSIGVAETTTVCAFQLVYRCADQALYAAKNAGRNRASFSRVMQMQNMGRPRAA